MAGPIHGFSVNHKNNPLKKILLFPLYRWGNWDVLRVAQEMVNQSLNPSGLNPCSYTIFSKQAHRWYNDLFCRHVESQQSALLGTLRCIFPESSCEVDVTVVSCVSWTSFWFQASRILPKGLIWTHSEGRPLWGILQLFLLRRGGAPAQ